MKMRLASESIGGNLILRRVDGCGDRLISKWEAVHPYPSEPTDLQVETLARRLYIRPNSARRWDQLPPESHDAYRFEARQALVEVLTPPPPQPPATREELVGALGEALVAFEGEEDSVKAEHRDLIYSLKRLLERETT